MLQCRVIGDSILLATELFAFAPGGKLIITSAGLFFSAFRSIMITTLTAMNQLYVWVIRELTVSLYWKNTEK